MIASATQYVVKPKSMMMTAFWIIDGSALLYLVSTLVKNFELRSRQAVSMFKVMGFVTAILLSSTVLWVLGHPYLALLVAGGPPVALASVFGLLMLIMLTAGKNVRWN